MGIEAHLLTYQEYCGINVEPNDPDHFAQAMIRLADNDDYRKDLAKNTARLGETMFNRNYLAEEMLAAML